METMMKYQCKMRTSGMFSNRDYRRLYHKVRYDLFMWNQTASGLFKNQFTLVFSARFASSAK